MSKLRARRSPLEIIRALRAAKKSGIDRETISSCRVALAESLERRQMLTVTGASVSPTSSPIEGSMGYFYAEAETNHDPAATSWTIEFGDGTGWSGSVNGSATIAHTYMEAGQYHVSAQVCDSSGTSSYGSYGPSYSTSYSGSCYSFSTQVSVADAPLEAIDSNTIDIGATEGANYSGVLGHFEDENPYATPADYDECTVSFGDGTDSMAGSIVSDGEGGYFVVANHTFAEEGHYSGYAYVHDHSGDSITMYIDATVADAPLTGSDGSGTFTLNKNKTLTVASVTDGNSAETGGDLSATIHWGDGSTSGGTLNPLGGGSFSIQGGHTYTSAGTFSGSVDVEDTGGSSAHPNFTATVLKPILSISSTQDAQENGADGNLHFTLEDPEGGSYPNPNGTSVSFSVGGTAVVGVNYRALGAVNIPAGASSVDVPVKALEDNHIDPTLTVAVTLSSSSNYAVGYGSATCDILDGDTRTITAPNILLAVGQSKDLEVDVSGMFSQADPVFLAGFNGASFSVSQASLTWSPTSEVVHLTVMGLAGAVNNVTIHDAVDNGNVGENTITVIQLNALTATDANDGTNTVTASGVNGTGNMYVMQNAGGSATINFLADITPNTYEAGGYVPWTISGTGASQTSGSFSANPATVTLTPPDDSSRVYTFTAGNSTMGTESITVTVVNVKMVGDPPEVFENSYQPMEVTIAPASAAPHVELSVSDTDVAAFPGGTSTLFPTQGDNTIDMYGGNWFGNSGVMGETPVDASIILAASGGVVAGAPPTTQPSNIGKAIADSFSLWSSDAIKFLQAHPSIVTSQIKASTDKAFDAEVSYFQDLHTADGDAQANALTNLRASTKYSAGISQAAQDLLSGNGDGTTASNFTDLDHTHLGEAKGYKPGIWLFDNGALNGGMDVQMDWSKVLKDVTQPDMYIKQVDFGLGIKFDDQHKATIQTGITYNPDPNLRGQADSPDFFTKIGFNSVESTGLTWSLNLNVQTHHQGDAPNSQIVGLSLTIIP